MAKILPSVPSLFKGNEYTSKGNNSDINSCLSSHFFFRGGGGGVWGEGGGGQGGRATLKGNHLLPLSSPYF